MTNMSFFNVFKAPSFALLNSVSQSNATGFENVENDMYTQTIPQSFTSTNLLIVYGVGNYDIHSLTIQFQSCLDVIVILLSVCK